MASGDEGPDARAQAWSGSGPSAPQETDPDESPADPWLGRVIGGRFKLLERVGAGGMAVVYRAQEQGLIRRDVAIKLLTPESALSQATLARFLKEAQVIAEIHHPNVVQVIDVGRTDDGQLYLVMELLVGRTLQQELREVVDRGEVFGWERTAAIALQVCGALKAAHKHKVLHRDIKPSNCFCVEVDGHAEFVKLLDFGIAKAQAGASADESIDTPLTQEGMFLGTPHYAAPEVIAQRPDWPVDGRVDVYAVGVMMYQMLTGTLPFQGHSKLDVLYKTVHEQPPSPRERAPERGIAVDVDALVMSAMAIDPNERFASVAALAAAIRAHSEALRPTTVPPPETGPRWPSGEIQPRSGLHPLRDGFETPPPPGELQLGTPPPPGELQLVSSATLNEPAPAASSRGTFAMLVGMLVGLVALLALLVHELGAGPEVPAKAAVVPRVAAPRPAPRAPVVEREPELVAQEAPVVEPEPIEDEAAAKDVADEEPETADLYAARKQQIRERVKALARGNAILRCLPDEVLPDDGVADEIAVNVSVDPEGRTRATAKAGGVKRRIPRSADACILGLVSGLRFPVADSTVEMTVTLSLD